MLFRSCGVFPVRGPARVLWIGISTGAAQVDRLYELVVVRLESVGIVREQRRFAPHLTVGRWQDGSAAARHRLPALGHVATQTVRGVTLFESHLRPAGAEHVPLTTGRLDGPPLPVH